MLAAAEACVGSVIAERYHVDHVLGAGGMGFVVAATHVLTGGKVALKVVPDDGASVDRLLVEARAPAMIRHPNIVRTIDVGHDDHLRASLLVQELLEGHDLRAELDKHLRLHWRNAVAIMLPVLDAIAAAHAAGVVHRDIKPENVFLAREGTAIVPRVLDFGIARIATPGSSSGRLTTVGAVFGTPCYMSPEQARGERDIDHRCDVWALGAVLHELVTGKVPFGGDDAQNNYAVISAVQSEAYRRPKNVPAAIADVIERALRKDRSKRWQSVAEMRAALAAAVPADRPDDPTRVTDKMHVGVQGSVRRQVSVLAAAMFACVAVVAFVVVAEVKAAATEHATVMRRLPIKTVQIPRLAPPQEVQQTRLAAADATAAEQAMVPAVVTPAIATAVLAPVVATTAQAQRVAPRHDAGVARVRVSRNGAPVFEP